MQRKKMIVGTLLVLVACFIWGLIFIVPSFITGFDSFEIALGRHSAYGITSLFFALSFQRKTFFRHSLRTWTKALKFSLIANILYYSCVVVGLKYSSPPLTALILGTSPILIAFYGNWLEKECRFQDLMIPSLLILIGLLFINLPILMEGIQEKSSYYLSGIIATLVALFAWSWYVVANTRFLKENRTIKPEEWSTLIGASTFIWVLLLGLFYEAGQGKENWEKFYSASPELWTFIGGSAILGVCCSWFGAYLWNHATFFLPISFMGQLLIFETLFGLLFFYLIELSIPPIYEIIGAFFMLAAILLGISKLAIEGTKASGTPTPEIN